MTMARKLKGTIVFLLKISLFICLFLLFFFIFSIDNPWLMKLSRTSGVTMVTFAVVGIALMSVFGGYAIGVQKSKPIIYNLSLATILTDLVTHLELSIMNAGPSKYNHFVYETPHLLLLVMVLQVLVITCFAYLGNFVYFSIEPPEQCCVIAASRQGLSHIIPKIQRFKKQYAITHIVRYTNPDIYEIINASDTVFLYDIPVNERQVLVEYCYQNNKNINYNFEMVDVVSMGAKTVTIDDKSLVTHVVKDMTFEQRVVKRLMDIFIAVVGILVTSPIMLASAIAIKCGDGGKVLYRQKRLTKYGRVFQVLKFRTMKEAGAVNRSVEEHDDRITKVGHVLRKFRLDELPQLFNILKGDMTMVGPRPEMLENVAKYTEALPEFSYRLRAKAGLTGLAQISGKYNTSPKDKLVLDLTYIENYRIWLDIKILFRTFTVFLKASESTEAFKQAESFSFDDPRDNWHDPYQADDPVAPNA